MSPAPEPTTASRLALVLALAPAAVLAWPFEGAPLAGDLQPHATGAAVALLASVPAALLAIARPALGGAVALPLGLLALLQARAVLAPWLESPSDLFGAWRAAMVLSVAGVVFVAGSRLERPLLPSLARVLVVLSLAWTVRALADGAERGFAGVLGNPGPLSQAALPGAVVGVTFALVPGVERTRPWRALGLAAWVAFAVHAGRAPVLAGALSCGAGLVAVALLGAAPTSVARRVACASFALLTLASPVAFRAAAIESTGAASPGEAAAADAGGARVRLLLWARLPSLLAEHPFLGTGSGMLRASFPPHRDPAEIALSTHDHAIETNEVEHLHNDWLEGVAEGGLVFGAAWLALLALVAAGAVRALRARSALLPLGAALVALLVNALFHGVLLHQPASSALAFLLAGVAARHAGPSALATPRALVVAVGALALVPIRPAALAAREGRALVVWNELHEGIEVVAEHGTPQELEARIEDATRWLDERGDELRGAFALSLRADALGRWGRPPEEVEAAWREVLEVRPHQLAALEQVGMQRIARGDFEGARSHWERARALDPENPRILRNLARLEALAGDREALARHLDALDELGALDPDWLVEQGSEMVLRGDLDAGTELLGRADPRLADPNADQVYARWSERRDAGSESALDPALYALSQRLFGRDHAASGDWSTAVRSLRQAVSATEAVVPRGAPPVRLELAAALLRAGRDPEARAALAGLEPSDRDRRRTAPWALEALERSGMLGP